LYKLATLIPTINRPTLQRSIHSIANQTSTPDEVIIISENQIDLISCENLKITQILNTRTQNLSGALNSGLEYILKEGWNPEETYISILDDDDEWEPTYLEKCFSKAVENGLDLVVSGIIRHTSKNESFKLEIPCQIDPEIFLTSNPHIQGSNFFVKFSALLMAGSFDERLESTTDRDICYRIFELGIKYDKIEEHLVHHWALDDQDRLSSPNSSKKVRGLTAFYKKYSPIMTESQRTQFKQRAETLFHCIIEEPMELRVTSQKIEVKTKHYFPMVIGFISSNLQTTESLIKDIKELFKNYPTSNRLVVCDNTQDPVKLEDLLKMHIDDLVLYDKDQIANDCDSGLFGSYLLDPANRVGIASGRTILQRYIYEEMKKIPGSVAWILDDDIRLEALQHDGTIKKINIDELNQTILFLKSQGIPIANGKITGDPPIPFLSSIRTQLLDLYYNQKRITKCNGNEKIQGKIYTVNQDYYYDLSDTNFTHLETPEYLDTIKNLNDIEDWIKKIMHGTNYSRPIIDYQYENTFRRIPPRGGNTLVLNPQCLRDYPNITPKVGSIPLRRGDSFWCILNYYHGGWRVSESPISVRHVRFLNRDNTFSFDRLKSDFYGSSFIKAIEDFYSQKNNELGWNPRRLKLRLDKNDVDKIIDLFKFYLFRRINNFIMNAYRTNGLIKIIQKYFTNSEIISSLNYLYKLYELRKIWKFREDVLDINYEVISNYLNNLEYYVRSYRGVISNEITECEIEHSRETLFRLGLVNSNSGTRLLGHGHEGTVFTDGRFIYKQFYYGKEGFPESRYEFILKTFLRNYDLHHYPTLLKIIDKDGELVFIFPFEESSVYQGGKLDNIQEFLMESKKVGIAVTNVHPKNFMVSHGVLKLVDVGRSIIPYSEKEYHEMCKRAYLTYRWYFREDISKLLSMALHDENIPELFGFQYFLESLSIKNKADILNDRIVNFISNTGSCSILDYGCGTGKISEKLSWQGHTVVGYDIDEAQIQENKLKDSNVIYLSPEELPKLETKFDKVLCCLVLCNIESNEEVTNIVRDLRKHVKDSGEVLVVICNPFNTFVTETETHIKQDLPDENCYHEKFIYQKIIKETGNIRKEIHRPYSYYEHLFHREGFEIKGLIEINSIDVRELAPASDFILFNLKPLKIHSSPDVSLIIKASAMEWKSIDFQIKHIINQLEGPQRFKQKIIVTDDFHGPYQRQYAEPNYEVFTEKLNILKNEGIIDRIIVVKNEPEKIRSVMKRWFNLDTNQGRCSNGQPTYTILKGFEEIGSMYLLHVDSDCIFVRNDRNHDYLENMVSLLESDQKAICVSFNIAHEEDVEYSYEKNGKPWRIETRCSLIHKLRLEDLLPLPNYLDENGLILDPWHRALDKVIKEYGYHSYRGGDKRTFYIHIQNTLKKCHNHWYNIIKAAERGQVPKTQMEHTDIQNIDDWLSPVDEEFVILVRGVNVPIPKLRRCLESVRSQDYSKWNIVFIDAASTNPMQEYLEKITSKEFQGKCTYWYNHERLTSMENIYIASTKLCVNPESIIIHLDADDALINTKVLRTLKKHYQKGTDLTVGSMLRTDKHKEYPINFDARNSRGGNVWQHLRSYKKYLFDDVPVDYFKIEGKWVPIAEDWAFMIPLSELAENPIHIIEPLYFYQPNKEKSDKTRRIRETVIQQIISKPKLK